MAVEEGVQRGMQYRDEGREKLSFMSEPPAICFPPAARSCQVAQLRSYEVVDDEEGKEGEMREENVILPPAVFPHGLLSM